jgi:transcriptional antiterminator RfaH
MSVPEEAAPWIAINTHPHRESIALKHLQRQEFETYCPLMPKRRSHARRVETVLRPLFPNYLFVRANWGPRRWRPILSTHGVRTIVRSGDELSFINHEFIASLKRREVDGAIVRPPAPYQVGQKVEIAGAAFAGLVATIIELGEKDRIVVLLDLMNRSTRVTLNPDALVPV